VCDEAATLEVPVTTHLPERLRELADDAPATLPATGLWQSGRRRHRRRVVVGVALVGAVVSLAAGLGYGDWRSRQPEPVSPPVGSSGSMAVPDRLFNPSPWLPTTRAPGRLVAVMSATRDHFPFGSDRNALAGVVAGSQTYRFLDLPGQAPENTDVALSPDGRSLAYWVTQAEGEPVGAVVGVAVLDLTTGTVERHLVPTRHGLAPMSLSWPDSRTVAMVSDHFTSPDPTSYAGRTDTYLFRLGDGTAYTRLVRSNVDDVPVTSTRGEFTGVVDHQVLRSYAPRTDELRPDVALSSSVKSVAYDVRRRLVAATAGNVDASGPTSGPLVVGHVRKGAVELRPVRGGRRYDRVLTWVDGTHVAAVRQTRAGLVYDVVDVRTGQRRELTSKPWYAFEIALDALQQARTVPGIPPPHPWNPRWIALGGLLVLLCTGGGALVLRRSRARP
jgi:hypothetical protein